MTHFIKGTAKLKPNISADVGDVIIEEVQFWNSRVDELVIRGRISPVESLSLDRSDLFQVLKDQFTYESVAKST